MNDSTAHLHLQYQDFKKTLTFYKSKISFFKEKLEEIVTKNTGEDIRKNVEHFENAFIVMNEKLDVLLHEVNIQQDTTIKDAKDKPTFIYLKVHDNADSLKVLVDETVTDFAKTKDAFLNFLSEHL